MADITAQSERHSTYVLNALDGISRLGAFLLPLGVLVILWEMSVRFGIADATILPAPTTVFARGVALAFGGEGGGVLFAHIATSLYRALAAFGLAIAVAIPLGFALGVSPSLYAWVSPLISVLLPLPAVAWTPVMLVAFGQGDATIITVCFLGAVFPVLYSTIQGVRSLSRESIWVVRSMGASRFNIFLRVMLPASLPALMSGLKLGMAHSWRTLVAAEMLAALSLGLGYMIFAARSYMDVATMFVGIICLAIIGMLIEHGIFGPIETRTIRKWHGSGKMGGGA